MNLEKLTNTYLLSELVDLAEDTHMKYGYELNEHREKILAIKNELLKRLMGNTKNNTFPIKKVIKCPH